VRRAAAAAVLLALMLGACASTDRPEGVVERWLISLNVGGAGQPERYAPDELSDRILPPPRNPNDLDVIEVGRGRIEGDTALVPYRVEVADGPKLDGVAQLTRTADGWRVAALLPKDPALAVPSEGGRHIGGAPASLWALSVVLAVALCLLSAGLMALFGRRPETPAAGSGTVGT
jgi:hypothetical protein